MRRALRYYGMARNAKGIWTLAILRLLCARPAVRKQMNLADSMRRKTRRKEHAWGCWTGMYATRWASPRSLLRCGRIEKAASSGFFVGETTV